MTDNFLLLAMTALADDDYACGCGSDCQCGPGCACGRTGKCAPACACAD